MAQITKFMVFVFNGFGGGGGESNPLSEDSATLTPTGVVTILMSPKFHSLLRLNKLHQSSNPVSDTEKVIVNHTQS